MAHAVVVPSITMQQVFCDQTTVHVRNYLSKCIVGFLIASAQSAHGDVNLPPLFSDRGVLQRSNSVPVWGRASPGERVRVTLSKAHAETVADADGKWRVRLDLHEFDSASHEMVVEGKNRLAIEDIVVGEVWVCSGQSNMWLSLESTTHGAQEVAASSNPLIRVYDNDHWRLCTPEVSGSFSAVGYYFGTNLQKELKCPIGLMIALQPATAIELWISPEALNSDPQLKVGKDRVMEAVERFKAYRPQFLRWEKENKRDDRLHTEVNAFAGQVSDMSDWKLIEIPGLFGKVGLPDAGAVWIRRQISIPPDMSGKSLLLQLGQIHHFSTVYWNGVKIAESSPAGLPGGYDCVIPADQVKAGEATLAIRIFSPIGEAGIQPGNASFKANDISLAGPWRAKAEFALPPMDEKAKSTCPAKPEQPAPPGMFFDYAVKSKIPYLIKGVIWYQGESNVERAWQYGTALPLMIRDWRGHWGQGNFPFYICQLPNINPHLKIPGESQWAELREAQTKATALPHTAQAVLIDAGEEADIHPKNKKIVGDRLALIALADTYGRQVVCSGPVFSSMAVEGDKIRVHFTHTDGGLVARDLPASYQPSSQSPTTASLVRNSPKSSLEGFTICGEDRQWKWADARIEGNDVVVWSESVPRPIALRYAWADNPICNLYNGAGLPARPFRTDEFAVSTVNARY